MQTQACPKGDHTGLMILPAGPTLLPTPTQVSKVTEEHSNDSGVNT